MLPFGDASHWDQLVRQAGDPAERPLDLIERDLRHGYVTPGHAEARYGVRVDPVTLRVTR